ncbi:MAG: hypothetical protein OXG60_07300 [Chloroflexi bacterium]|nr:hypothetical protein [Chloroflexota bacterium]
MAREITNDTLQQQPPQLGERVARLEGAYPHLATKEDLQAMQATLIKWIVGTGIAILIAIIAVLQWFFPVP